jgi:hypothetical protein
VPVLLDPVLRITPAEYRTLHDVRLRAYALQREAAALAARLDEAKRALGAAVGTRDTASMPVRAARAAEAEIDEVLLALRGRQPAGGGFGGGGGGGGAAAGAAQPVVTRVNGVASAIGNVHFAPTDAHRETLDTAAADLARLTARAESALARVPDALRGLGVRR